jgi:hypothetical protein
VVVLYAMTNPQHTPWKVASRVLYFEVRPELAIRNQLLQTFPGVSTPRASPQKIVEAVNELAGYPGMNDASQRYCAHSLL